MSSVWFETLVIILSTMLGLFLLLSIILLVWLLKIVKQIRRIMDHAEQAVDKAEQVADFFQKTATPVALIKLVSNITDFMQNTSNKKDKKK